MGNEAFVNEPDSQRPLRVFLCHASSDKPTVRQLYQRLCAEGIDAWLDEEKLLPGQDWQLEIPKAVRASDVVIVCLSHSSVSKSGYVQKEIRFALDVADEQPEGTIYLIPLKLEECNVPSRLSRWQWVNFYEEKGWEKLMRALKARGRDLGIDVALKEVPRTSRLEVKAGKAEAEQLKREVREKATRDEAERQAELAEELEARRQAKEEVERQAKLAAEKTQAELLEHERQEREAREKAAKEAERRAELEAEEAEAERRKRQKYLTKLRGNLVNCFNREELRSLCADLDIEYENFPDVKDSMSRELVEYCERRGRIPELVTICSLLRPSVSWEDTTTSPKVLEEPRRIDAAVPSHAQVGQRIDLLVQVRFPMSPLLGIDDWRGKQKPVSVEQASEPVALKFPVDRQTGEPSSACLEIRVVAPDFIIEGKAQQLVEVLPGRDSKLVSFLLTATKVGSCRVNVEVYSIDRVYLGTVPLETVVGETVVAPTIMVASLPFTVTVAPGYGVTWGNFHLPLGPSSEWRPESEYIAPGEAETVRQMVKEEAARLDAECRARERAARDEVERQARLAAVKAKAERLERKRLEREAREKAVRDGTVVFWGRSRRLSPLVWAVLLPLLLLVGVFIIWPRDNRGQVSPTPTVTASVMATKPSLPVLETVTQIAVPTLTRTLEPLPTLTATETPIATDLWNFRVETISNSRILVMVNYSYSGDHGGTAALNVEATRGRERRFVRAYTYIGRGQGKVAIEIYCPASNSFCDKWTTDKIWISMHPYPPDRADPFYTSLHPFYEEMFDYVKTWSRDPT